MEQQIGALRDEIRRAARVAASAPGKHPAPSGTLRRFTAGLLAIFVVATPGTGGAPPRAPLPRLRWPVAVIGHRAGAGIAPENTLGAIRQAIRLRVDYVEVDVRTTRDGAFVIMHDPTVDRTTGGHGTVRDLTLAEIRGLAVKNRFGPDF